MVPLRKLDRDETDFMRSYIQEGVERGETEEQIRERRKELTQICDCTLSQVSGAVAWKNKGTDTLVLEPLNLSSDTENNGTSSPEKIEPPNNTEEPIKITGANYDYDNPEKNEWRSHIINYLCQRIPREDRQSKKILCLGGGLNLEPQAYIEKGFLPENILSVESDSIAIPQFIQSAQQLGIKIHVGDLHTLDSSEYFDVVSLDYTGPLGSDKLEHIKSILLANDSYVLLNVQQKRDPENARQVANLTQVTSKAIHSGDPNKSGTRTLHEIQQSLLQKINQGDSTLSPAEWEIERKKMMAVALGFFGRNRSDQYAQGFPELSGLMSDEPTSQIRYAIFIKKFSRDIFLAYEKRWKVTPPQMVAESAIAYMQFFELFFTRRPVIKEVEYYKYHSERNGRKNPFQTILAHMQIPNFYSKKSRTFFALGNLLEEMASADGKGKLVIEDSLGRMVMPLSADLCFKNDGNVAAKINLNTLANDFSDFRDTEDRNPELYMNGEIFSEEHQRSRGKHQASQMTDYWNKVEAKQQKAFLKNMQPRRFFRR